MVKRVDAGNAYGMNAAIALPERNIILPRFEFPRWLRFPRGVSDERVARMLAPLGGALSPLAVTTFQPFNPVTDIANAIVGFDYTSTLYQDSARTTLATSQDDVIGSISDLVGTNHAAQGTTANKFLLKLNPYTGCTRAWYSGDHNRFAVTPSISHGVGTSDFYMVWVGKVDTFQATDLYRRLIGNGDDDPELYLHNNKLNLYWGGDHNGATTISYNTRYIIEVVRASGTVTYYVNGTADANTFSIGTSAGNGIFTLNSEGAASPALSGHFEAAWFYKTAPTSQQRANMRTYYGF